MVLGLLLLKDSQYTADSFREAMIGGDKMTIVALEATNLCSYTDDQKPEYVFFTGGIAGISDSQTLERSPESFNRCTDEVELHRD